MTTPSPYLVIDCPDPNALADFYAAVLGLPIASRNDEWVAIGGEGKTRIAFQLVKDYQPPQWPDSSHPQQMHLDIEVDDVDSADRRVRELGATRLPGEGEDFRVFADPAGHPFCLIFDT